MRVLSVLNILFVIFVGFCSFIKVNEMYNSPMVDIENFNFLVYFVTLIAFFLCGIIILVFEKPFAKYLYLIEFVLYVALSTIIASPLISIFEKIVEINSK